MLLEFFLKIYLKSKIHAISVKFYQYFFCG